MYESSVEYVFSFKYFNFISGSLVFNYIVHELNNQCIF